MDNCVRFLCLNTALDYLDFPFKYGVRIRYAAITVNLTINAETLGFPTGIPIRNHWEDFMNDKVGIIYLNLKRQPKNRWLFYALVVSCHGTWRIDTYKNRRLRTYDDVSSWNCSTAYDKHLLLDERYAFRAKGRVSVHPIWLQWFQFVALAVRARGLYNLVIFMFFNTFLDKCFVHKWKYCREQEKLIASFRLPHRKFSLHLPYSFE